MQPVHQSSRHVQILVDQTVVAETDQPVLLIETGVPPRWYIPPGDVVWAQLEPVPASTICQYKGEGHLLPGAQQRCPALGLPPF